MPSLCDDLLFWNGAYAEFARIPARVVRQNLLPLARRPGLPGGGAWWSRWPASCGGWRRAGSAAASRWPSSARARSASCSWPWPACAARTWWPRAGDAQRLDKALEHGGGAGGRRRRGRRPGRAAPGAEPRTGAAPDVVIEAVGLPGDVGGRGARGAQGRASSSSSAGCPADTRIGIDSQRLHYQELTIKSTFHHTPESVRKAFRLIADGHIDPNAFITAEAPAGRPARGAGPHGPRRRRAEDGDPSLGTRLK